MTQEEKQLLLRDLCGRLPYEVYVSNEKETFVLSVKSNVLTIIANDFKPYLRPMSSMTDEEKKEYKSFFSIGEYSCGGSLNGEEYEYIADSRDDISQSISLFDWLNAHHFDYRGLIEEGLALEAPEGMYKTN